MIMHLHIRGFFSFRAKLLSELALLANGGDSSGGDSGGSEWGECGND